MHNCMQACSKANCEETLGLNNDRDQIWTAQQKCEQAHWENITCCLASHKQEVKASYFCSVNCIALESLVLDYPLESFCPYSEEYQWHVREI